MLVCVHSVPPGGRSPVFGCLKEGARLIHAFTRVDRSCRITNFQVTPNFTLKLAKLDNQYDSKKIPSLISVVSADSKTLGHRIGAFQGALQVLQSIVLEMQQQGGIGGITGKQLSVILDQVHTTHTRIPTYQPRGCFPKYVLSLRSRCGGTVGDDNNTRRFATTEKSCVLRRWTESKYVGFSRWKKSCAKHQTKRSCHSS